MIVAPDGFEKLPPLVNPLVLPEAAPPDPRFDTQSVAALKAAGPGVALRGRPDLPLARPDVPVVEQPRQTQAPAGPPVVPDLLSETVPSDNSVTLLARQSERNDVPATAVQAYERGSAAPAPRASLIA